MCAGSPNTECAYPNVTGRPPDYASDCGGLPQKACGSHIVFKNTCNSRRHFTAGVKVADHGPKPWLVSGIDEPRCNPNLCNWYVDLVRSTRIGWNGDLQEGLMLCLVHP